METRRRGSRSRGSSRKASTETREQAVAVPPAPAVVVEAVRKSLRKSTSIEEKNKDFIYSDSKVINRMSDSVINDLQDEENSLVIDDLIDNFGDDLEDEMLAVDEETKEKNSGKKANKEDIEEEIEEEIQDEVDKFDFCPEVIRASGNVRSQKTYGKLWEFIRDLLKNERYNPSVISWEDVEAGQFRIVDSGVVAQLWAAVKGNKRMNYEKLSRAMRYYYKYNIFEIVPHKRLVYKFGSRATNWKPAPAGAGRPGEPGWDPTWAAPPTRCTRCLCVLDSPAALRDHRPLCSNNVEVAESERRRDGDKLRSHILARPGTDPDTGLPLRHKLSEIRARPLPELLGIPATVDDEIEAEPAENRPKPKEVEEATEDTETNLEKGEVREALSPTAASPTALSPTARSASEQVALESLMSLGESVIPATVSEVANAVGETEPDSEPSGSRSYVVIPSAVPEQQTRKPQLSSIADKISFLKSAAEKSKTQTILQKRAESAVTAECTGTQCNEQSDDEVEIVKIVKSAPTVPAAAPLAVVVAAAAVAEPGLERKASIPIKINKKYLPILAARPAPDKPSEPARPPSTSTKIRVNPKYTNIMAGRRPEECENIAVGEETSRPRPPPALLPLSCEVSLAALLAAPIPDSATPLDLSAARQPGKRPLGETEEQPGGKRLQLRRHSDAGTGLAAGPGAGTRSGEVVPVPGLWQFLCALLHNPGYNPKLVTWEMLEEGMFRIHNLSDFYQVWRSHKAVPINYDLLTKTLKVYDEQRLLHSVSHHRCVYKEYFPKI